MKTNSKSEKPPFTTDTKEFIALTVHTMLSCYLHLSVQSVLLSSCLLFEFAFPL